MKEKIRTAIEKITILAAQRENNVNLPFEIHNDEFLSQETYTEKIRKPCMIVLDLLSFQFIRKINEALTTYADICLRM